MTPEQITRYQNRLIKMADKVEGLVAALEREGLHPLGGEDSAGESFPPEGASEAYEQEQTIVFIEEEAHLRDEIVTALRRIRQGSFGHCERCGRSISQQRLNALPFTRYCITCEKAVEAEK